MSKLILSFLFLVLFNPFAFADADTLKKYSAIRTTDAPRIDGKLDDEVWKPANIISDFVMNRPVEGGTVTQRTEVKIIYDNNAVYVGAMLFDTAPDSILHELGLRDGADPSNTNNGGFTDINADYFRFVIDPYNTRQDAYDFGVYASGVQADARFSDYLFDAVWESAAQINDKGWVVEMKIPYSAIRFPAKPVQQWALQITRNIRRNREFDQWSLTPSTAFNSQSYWGNMNGIENIKPPVRLSLTPYISATYERAPVTNEEGNKEISNAYSYRAGADIKWGLDERFTLDMTLLPDFGQVQSDNKIKTLGYEEIIYDENRPFFKEGTDLFAKGSLFYTRRIGKLPSGFFDVEDVEVNDNETIKENPTQVKLLNAAKLSGRTDEGLGIGLFNAVTDNMYAIVEDENGDERKVLTEPLTNFNVLVLDKQWKNNSSLYFINTNVARSKKYDDANVTGSGFTFINKKKTYGIDGSAFLSQQFSEKDSLKNNFDVELGYNYFLGVRKISGWFQWGLSQTQKSAEYNPLDLGYYVIPDRNNYRLYMQLFRFKPYKFIREGDAYLGTTYITNHTTGDRTFWEINSSAFANLLSYNAIYGGAGFTPLRSFDYDPRLNGRYFKSLRYWYGYIGISTDYRKRVALDLTQNMSNFSDRFLSEGFNTDATLRFRVSDKLTVNYKFSHYRDPFNFGYVDELDDNVYLFGGRKTNTFINQASVRYIFKNDLSLSVIARHYWFNVKYRAFFNLDDDGDFTEINDAYDGTYDLSYNSFNADVLFSWRFAPGSTLSFSYKNIFDAEDPLSTLSFSKNFNYVFDNPHTQTLSLKVLYYLDYLYLRKKG